MIYHIPADQLTAGSYVVADAGFTCLFEGQVVRLKADVDALDLFFICDDGGHYMAGQLGTPDGNYRDDIYVGFRPARWYERLWPAFWNWLRQGPPGQEP